MVSWFHRFWVVKQSIIVEGCEGREGEGGGLGGGGGGGGPAGPIHHSKNHVPMTNSSK